MEQIILSVVYIIGFFISSLLFTYMSHYVEDKFMFVICMSALWFLILPFIVLFLIYGAISALWKKYKLSSLVYYPYGYLHDLGKKHDMQAKEKNQNVVD